MGSPGPGPGTTAVKLFVMHFSLLPPPHRTGSVMERRAITPPVGSPVGRPLYLPPDRNILSLDKIAKRECKVLVLESHS